MAKTLIKKAALKVGDNALLFKLNNQKGEPVDLQKFLGQKNVLLIFYPGDDTPGCTAQLCALRDDYRDFDKKDIVIFGVNQADENSHQKFISKFKFPFDLLIDTDRQISEKYGAIKYMFGHKSIKRSVVLIDKQGKIIFLKRGMPHDEEILASLK